MGTSGQKNSGGARGKHQDGGGPELVHGTRTFDLKRGLCHGSCPTSVSLNLRHDSLYLMTPRLTSYDSFHVRYLLVVADCLPIPSTAIPSCGGLLTDY